MKNKFPIKAVDSNITDEKLELAFNYYSLLEDAADLTIERIKEQLVTKNLSLKEEFISKRLTLDDIRKENVNNYVHHYVDRRYVIPELVEKFKGYPETELFGHLGLLIDIKPRTEYEGSYRESREYILKNKTARYKNFTKNFTNAYEAERGRYDVLNNRPLHELSELVLKNEYPGKSLKEIEKRIKKVQPNYISNFKHRHIALKGDSNAEAGNALTLNIPLFFNCINYTFLRNSLEEKIPFLANKYNLFFGDSIMNPQSIMSKAFIIIPDDLDNFSIKPFLDILEEMGTSVQKRYNKLDSFKTEKIDLEELEDHVKQVKELHIIGEYLTKYPEFFTKFYNNISDEILIDNPLFPSCYFDKKHNLNIPNKTMETWIKFKEPKTIQEYQRLLKNPDTEAMIKDLVFLKLLSNIDNDKNKIGLLLDLFPGVFNFKIIEK